MRIIITESQSNRLKQYLNETSIHGNIVKQIKDELDNNYVPVGQYVRQGGEYFDKPMIKIKVDGELITPKSLYEYLQYKYKVGDEFIKQLIKDWMFNKINDDYSLSKNVPLN